MNYNRHIMTKLEVWLGNMPFISTEQAARAFPHLKWSQKEASKYLKELERMKCVEGYERGVGKSLES